MGFRQIRLKFNGHFIVRLSATIIAQERFSSPPIVIGFRIIRLKSYRLVVVHYGSTIVTQTSVGSAPFVMGFRQIRLEVNNLIIAHLRVGTPSIVVGFHQLILLVYLLSGIRPIFVGFRIIRLESDRLVVIRDSFTIIPQASFDNPPFVVGFRH